MFSAKTGYPGMNLQIAATLDGALAAVGPVPVHGARHDAHAFAASGLADVLTDHPTLADLGYVGVEGIDTVPYKRFPGIDLNTGQSRVQHRRSARPAPPSNTPSRTSRHGACSAKKAVATEHHWKSTRACSKQSSAYSSSRLMNKPLGTHRLLGGEPVQTRQARLQLACALIRLRRLETSS